MYKSKRAGFTLVELLVVIAIIGTLIALLLPAVQAAREAGRRATCQNNLKQLASACAQHLAVHQHFPTGGWGERSVGLPNKGYGAKQPGGWIYNILPFIEQENLHDLGVTGKSIDVPTGSAHRCKTPLPVLHCPSRRDAEILPVTEESLARSPNETAGPLERVARNDYAINGGTVAVIAEDGGPVITNGVVQPYTWPDTSMCNGISFMRSQVTAAHVAGDGMSNTYLIGEKYIDINHYLSGQDEGDNSIAFSGDEEDLVRWGRDAIEDDGSTVKPWVPLLDKVNHPDDVDSDPDNDTWHCFGSPHAGGCYFAFCDGHVRLINYSIDAKTHELLANRKDGEVPDMSELK